MSPNRRVQRPLRPAPPRRSFPLKRILIIVLIIAAAATFVWFTIPNEKDKVPKQSGAQKAAFNMEQFSLTDPASPWVIVNKQRSLNPSDYAPAGLAAPNIPLRLTAKNEEMQLSSVAIPALEELVAAAKQEGLELMLASGYRSFNFQKNLYNSYVRSIGQAEADKTSARAGYSEHQTGLAADLEPVTRECEIDICFGYLPEGEWLAANAWKYGFVIRYPLGSELMTGYEYEPWHLRFVGKELAAEVHEQNIAALEEFFSLPGAASY